MTLKKSGRKGIRFNKSYFWFQMEPILIRGREGVVRASRRKLNQNEGFMRIAVSMSAIARGATHFSFESEVPVIIYRYENPPSEGWSSAFTTKSDEC